ncbi:MAG: dephospho-CoA kinase [Phycisphaerales bacterium]|nr:dephospho-CoA kinase [Phycisphaerales bacterium]
MKHNPPIIGIVGGIGSGKSLVANTLKANGCIVADADEHTSVALDREDVQRTLVSWWGEKALDSENKVDRAFVASIVFENQEERARLEGLLHPIVKELQEKLFAQAPKGTKAFIIDAPLLLETGLEKDCDAIIYVDCPFETRLKRVIEHRGWSEQELRNREDAQFGLDKKQSWADYIIINDGDIAYVEEQVREVLSLICKPFRHSNGSGE